MLLSQLEEDLNTLQKKYANLENEFDKVNEGLIEANTKLETSEKRVNEVSGLWAWLISSPRFFPLFVSRAEILVTFKNFWS